MLKIKLETKPIMLYHCSREGLNGGIRGDMSRKVCDFGKGFYTYTTQEQADMLALNSSQSKVYTLHCDLSNLKVYEFTTVLKWAMFVGMNRGYIDLEKLSDEFKAWYHYVMSADVIVGFSADECLQDVLPVFFNGLLTDIALTECIRGIEGMVGKQYVFKTVQACERIQFTEQECYSLTATQIENVGKYRSQLMRNITGAFDKVKVKYRREGNFLDEIVGDFV